MRLFLAQGATSRAPVRIGQVPFRRDAGLEFRVVAVGEQRQVEYFPEKRYLLDFGVLRPDGIRKQMAMAQEQEEQTEGVKVQASGRVGGVGWGGALVWLHFPPVFGSSCSTQEPPRSVPPGPALYRYAPLFPVQVHHLGGIGNLESESSHYYTSPLALWCVVFGPETDLVQGSSWVRCATSSHPPKSPSRSGSRSAAERQFAIRA
jgi:hypothetical protein